MSVQTISLILFNSITNIFFFKYFTTYLYAKLSADKDQHMSWLLTKINKLETEINELHETIDSLEYQIQEKEYKLKESSEILFNKIDNFIVSNYETVQNENSISSHETTPNI